MQVQALDVITDCVAKRRVSLPCFRTNFLSLRWRSTSSVLRICAELEINIVGIKIKVSIILELDGTTRLIDGFSNTINKS